MVAHFVGSPPAIMSAQPSSSKSMHHGEEGKTKNHTEQDSSSAAETSAPPVTSRRRPLFHSDSYTKATTEGDMVNSYPYYPTYGYSVGSPSGSQGPPSYPAVLHKERTPRNKSGGSGGPPPPPPRGGGGRHPPPPPPPHRSSRGSKGSLQQSMPLMEQSTALRELDVVAHF